MLVDSFNRSGQANAVIIALIWKESRFDPTRSPDGVAIGLMQLRPIAVAEVNRIYKSTFRHSSMTNPALNILVGTLYLGIEVDRAGSLRLGLNNYGTGPGYADSILRAAEGLGRANADPMDVLREQIGR